MKFFNAAVLLFVLFQEALALPVDWSGSFGVDTTRMKAYRFDPAMEVDILDDTTMQPTGEKRAVPSQLKKASASFQTYLLRLQPTIIVNDAASLFGEITTGYSNGGHFGQGVEQAYGRGLGNALYNYSTYRDALHIRQIYTKYYSDAATYIVGRQPMHWGLGAIFNDGRGKGDRFASIEDGITAHLNIGNFRFSPYYMKVSGQNLDNSGGITSRGVQMLYRSSERDMSLGILFGERDNKEGSTFLKGTEGPLGSAEVKVIDLYLQKGFKKINLELEIPIMDGKLGHVYGENEDNGYNAKAFVGKASYELNPSWKLGLDLGNVSGDQGKKSSNFEALYLHPNYHIAHLMFRYNMHAVDKNESIFDSYITNANFTKFSATYHKGKWIWNMAFIWATATETAEGGSEAFNHERNVIYKAEGTQDSSYGSEIDLDFEYKWNSNVSILGSLGYHFVGDYYKYGTNSDVGSVYAAQLRTIVHF